MIPYTPENWYWLVGDDESQVYSSAAGKFVEPTEGTYTRWKEDGGIPTRIDTFDNLIVVLRAANVPPYHRVRKSTIIFRLTDPQLEQALSVMTVRQRERWYAPDQGYINADDPESIAVVTAIGADPSVVLAPE